MQNKNYYECQRREMLEFIPEQTQRVLEIGCGTGEFSHLLKSSIPCEIWGVELNESAALTAMNQLDKVIVGHLFEVVNEIPKNYFDCIVMNDVIEHFPNSEELLNNITPLMVQNGSIVASIPNVRYITNLFNLLVKKDWQYSDSGILDRTHLRFFTKKSIQRTFSELGFEIVTMKGINRFPKRWFFNLFNILTLGLFSDSQYLQWACVAKKK